MKQLFPVGGFQWANPELDEVLATPDDAPVGYVLEADLDYRSNYTMLIATTRWHQRG